MNDKKKVLVIGAVGGVFNEPHVRAFQELGFECIIFHNRRGLIYSSQKLRQLIRVFPLLRFIKTWSVRRENQKLLKLVRNYKPWLVFSMKAESISLTTIKEIKTMGIVTAVFFNDLMDHWELIKSLARSYDYFFNQDHLVLRRLHDELGLNNAYYMAHATEPAADPFSERENKYNISFIGTHSDTLYASREKYLLAVKDLGLNIWGTDGWARTAVKECFRGKSIGDQRYEIYSRSKIVVDINWDNLPAEGLSNRPFEVTGCGALFMTDNVRADIYRAYEVGKEVVVFKDENDLRDKVRYYLDNEEERVKMARAGYAKTLIKHTYVERMKMLLDVIENPSRYAIK